MGVEEQDDEPSSVVERGGTEVEREGEGWLFGECVLVTAALFGVAMKERDDGMERNRFVTNFNRMNAVERFRQKRQMNRHVIVICTFDQKPRYAQQAGHTGNVQTKYSRGVYEADGLGQVKIGTILFFV